MPLSQQPLGMNARNFIYIRQHNKGSAKRIADDKLATKERLIAYGASTPALIASFKNHHDVRTFGWSTLPGTFVVKPARGYGGEGIMVVSKWNGSEGKTIRGEVITTHDIEARLFDILEGAYSLQSLPDNAFIEEKLNPQRFFKKTLSIGLPDIRVIVFNGVPIMAMVRVPTEESDGKANLHLGAIGVGVDIATGVTTQAVLKNHILRVFPGTKVKPHGLKIPMWEEVLVLACKAQRAVGLGFTGVDIVIDAVHGPVVLEVNARPGLSIQNVNADSLRTRLERVSFIDPPTIERGIDIAQSLFAEPFSDKVGSDGPIIIGIIESVKVVQRHGAPKKLRAKIDSGAYRTSIDGRLAKKLGLTKTGKTVEVHSASGSGERETVHISFSLHEKMITTEASITNREHLRFPMIVGRRDMSGFYIDPTLYNGADDDDDDDTDSEEDEQTKKA
jgi:alpha-L-glutamate ligase-like protein